jgi:hypothetical protein
VWRREIKGHYRYLSPNDKHDHFWYCSSFICILYIILWS